MNAKEMIARRVALELENGNVVNLGIGLPTMVANYLPEGVDVTLQSENGFVGLGSLTGDADANLTNAGGQPCGIIPGAAMFDSAMSFMLIRGGHVDVTVLGGLEVDEAGNLANWMVPGKMVPGMGGAMDLVTGAKKVIIAMEHCAKDGSAKILKKCRLPLTGKGVVDLIITELGVFRVTKEGLVLEEIAPRIDVESVTARTEANFIISPDLKLMQNIL
ncbi:3-oxoacid CoA-transferase subunit B [Sporomusa malonica]|uniref:Probable succinyl-CoA:3-ketoacid coenzyme A transferase subunit B n=1 Tax=Sporomusa malonica TaxID=112901 RepID=A0A1W2BD94_9FIRM|nr:3-oxoacid CoA-transferase subunit B [Sporomusa malonica]SMC70740.1 acetate CoA/acetoacetate CoA-transferase beta subunit [Sporomusa malonica]